MKISWLPPTFTVLAVLCLPCLAQIAPPGTGMGEVILIAGSADGADGNVDTSPEGSKGGTIEIYSGRTIDTGGGFEDLTADVTLDNEDRAYNQISKGDFDSVTITVRGHVTIRCEHTMMAAIVADYSGGPPEVEVYVGQPDSTLGGYMFSLTMPHIITMDLDVPEAYAGTDAGTFKLYTTAQKTINATISASGGDGAPGFDGGDGGDIVIHGIGGEVHTSVCAVMGGDGGDGDEVGSLPSPGGKGGQGGTVYIKAEAPGGSSLIRGGGLCANGGEGGKGGRGFPGRPGESPDSFEYVPGKDGRQAGDGTRAESGLVGADGGDGGRIVLEADAIELTDPMIKGGDGGLGGQGGLGGLGGSGEPGGEGSDGVTQGGIGGHGGRGGDGAKGGDGGMGGSAGELICTSDSTVINSHYQELLDGGRGGQGGTGGTGGLGGPGGWGGDGADTDTFGGNGGAGGHGGTGGTGGNGGHGGLGGTSGTISGASLQSFDGLRGDGGAGGQGACGGAGGRGGSGGRTSSEVGMHGFDGAGGQAGSGGNGGDGGNGYNGGQGGDGGCGANGGSGGGMTAGGNGGNGGKGGDADSEGEPGEGGEPGPGGEGGWDWDEETQGPHGASGSGGESGEQTPWPTNPSVPSYPPLPSLPGVIVGPAPAIQLEVVAFKPELWPDGLTPGALSGLNDPRKGLAADGLSKLLIRAKLGLAPTDPLAPPQFTFVLTDETEGVAPLPDSEEVGALHDPGNPPADPTAGFNSVTVTARQNSSNQWVAEVVMQAPLDYIRTYSQRAARDKQDSTRDLVVKVYEGAQSSPNAQQSPAGEVTVKLYRPPVFFVHGLWGYDGVWGWNSILEATGYEISEIKYATDASWFASNVPVVAEDIRVKMEAYRRRHNIVATQADVFAHSMGGVLCRLFTTDTKANYLRADNYYQGDMHKLVLLNSPQFGSELANLLVDKQHQKTQLGIPFDFIFEVDEGAVYDLRVDGPAIDEMLSLPSFVPAHAMYSAADPISLGHGSGIPAEAAQVALLYLICGLDADDAFNGMPNDTIVNVVSQKADLSDAYLTRIEGDKRRHNGDYGVKMSADAAAKAVKLLEEPVDGGHFRQGGFPVTATRLAEPPACDRPLPYAGVALDIQVVPGDDANDTQTFLSGQTVTVLISSSEGFDPLYVMLKTSPKAEVAYTGLWRANVTIPVAYVGDFEIQAYGFNTEQFAMSEELVLHIDPPAELEELTVGVDEVVLTAEQPEYQVQVAGSFADDVDRDLTNGATGTTYLIEDRAVATVTGDGRIVAQSVGQTLLLVVHGEHVAGVRVVVESSEGQ